MSKFQAVRGTKDILPDDAAAFERFESISRSVFKRYGYREIRTPTFESLELFQRSLGETTDVVQKEMYVLQDRGGRELALRPEGTAGVVRAFVEHHLSQSMPFCKLFYIGPMFRAERPQAGRYREFWQAGVESFGNPSPAADAEMLLMIQALLSELGLGATRLKLNSLGDPESRARYVETLRTYLKVRQATLCEDCQRRMELNPLRALDCKTCGPGLSDAPLIDASWGDAPRRHFQRVRALLDQAGGAYEFTPRLVRGLDYYTGTVFEFTSAALGAQDALAAGGRYDGLVKEIGGPPMPAIGFAMGIERTLEAIRASIGKGLAATENALYIFVAALGDAASARAFELLQTLRRDRQLADAGIRFDGGFFEKKLGAQIQMADKSGATHCLILGEDELARHEVTLRDLRTGAQSQISWNDISQTVSNLPSPKK